MVRETTNGLKTLTAAALAVMLGLALTAQGCATNQLAPVGSAADYAAYTSNPYEGSAASYGFAPYAPFMYGFYDPLFYNYYGYGYGFPYYGPYGPYLYAPYIYSGRPPHRPRVAVALTPRTVPHARIAPPRPMRPMEAPMFRGMPSMHVMHMSGSRR